MKKKKVLHLITGLSVGGAETMMLKTLPLLQGDFENEVCCIIGHGSIGEELEKKGIPVRYLNLRPSNILFLPHMLGKIFREYRPDLLVTYLIHADLVGRIIGRMYGVKHIICNQRGFYLDWKPLRLVDRFTKTLVSRYVVQTEYAQKELMKLLHLPAKRFSIIPNAISLEDFQFSLDIRKKKEELKIPFDDVVIICVSNLKPRKGYEELLASSEETYQYMKGITLLVVGRGNQKEKYREQIKNYSSKSKIHFLGSRSDVKELLKISDIFVLATHSEGMSNALLEAMATKLPIITTDIEVNRALIEPNVSGILVPIKNPHALAMQIQLLIKNKNDRIALGEHAYRTIEEKFEMKKIVSMITSVYEEIIYGS